MLSAGEGEGETFDKCRLGHVQFAVIHGRGNQKSGSHPIYPVTHLVLVS